ncbi:MAG: SGNH/GDSL hydrolase family protein [Pyrinomonadaceae bacterium]
MRTRFPALFWSLLLGLACSTYAQSTKVERQRQLEPAIKTFEELDKKEPPPKGAVLFIGSSSIALWKSLGQDFPAVRTINRGFGGSHVEDSIDFADRIVIPYRPRLIVMYAGDNDIESGKSPFVVLEDFKRFVTVVHRKLPRTRIAFISIKPSPARWRLVDQVREANRLTKDFMKTNRRLDYIDVFSSMLGKDGKPRPELYIEDNLHMSQAGYELWRSLVAPRLR